MNRRKRLTALLLALAMCLSILPANVLAVELGSEGEATEVVESKDSGEPVEGEPIEAEEPQATEQEETVQEPEKDESPSTMAATSGRCGKNVTWKLDSKGTLTISGTGEMYDYFAVASPWEPHIFKIKAIDIKEGVTKIGAGAFSAHNVKTLKIPNSVTSIGESAFSDWVELNSIIIPDGVTNIPNCTFKGCSGLKSVVLSKNVTYIGEGAFSGCSGLKSIELPEAVERIDDIVFLGCENLKEIYFKGSAPILDANAFGESLAWPERLTATAYYPENDPTWTSDKRKNYGGNIMWKTWNPVFDAAVYQADYMLQHDNGYEENRMFQEVSPSKTFYEAGEKQGLTSSIKSWKAVTNALDMMDKPSTLLDVGFERKDMYSAVVLSIFEADSKKSHTVVRYSDQAVKWSGKLLGYLKKAMKLKYNIELTKTYDLSKLTKVQKQSLFAMANEWMENQDTLLKKAINGVDIAGKVMQYVKEFSSWCDYVASCSMLVSLDCYNKQLVKEMYQEATNADLKAALKDCITIMDSDPVELYLAELSKLGKKTVKVMVQQGLDAGWKVTKAAAAKVNPYVAWIWISYNGSKALCNALFNTDKISENYCKMEVLLQVEKVLLAVYKDAKSACETELNHDHAELLIHAYRLLYNCFDVDCQYALNFVNAVDKAVASRIARALKRKDREALKAQIADIRQNTEQTYWSRNNAWIEELSSTHPEEYPKYQNWERYQLAAVQITISPAKSAYTGKKLEPKVSVLDNLVKKNTKLKEGEDYAISYDNNKNVGTATVTVVGNSIYYGEVTKTFDIIPKGVSSVTVSNQKGKKLKVSWKPNKSVNGYEIQYALDKNYQKAKKTTVKKAKETGKVIGGLKKNKKYFVRVRTYQKASGKNYYSNWSKTKTVTIKK